MAWGHCHVTHVISSDIPPCNMSVKGSNERCLIRLSISLCVHTVCINMFEMLALYQFKIFKLTPCEPLGIVFSYQSITCPARPFVICSFKLNYSCKLVMSKYRKLYYIP